MKKRKIPHQKRNGDTSPPCRFSIGRIAYMAFLCPTVSLMFSQPAFAATDVWTKATEIMQDVYTQILAISTIAAIVTASVALLLMNFSRSGKTVDESRAWLKRIVITWAILNSLGFIMSYIGEVYRLLTLSGESDLDSLFENLPPTHPAKAPYSLYKQASDTVRSGVIIGLGSRLQVFQSELIKKITTRDEIDLELPGQERCAYFLVTSDQDSTFDFLASLFLSFCFIKLVRYADKNCEGGKLPVPVHVLGEELTACGTIPDLSRRLSVIRSRNISMSCVFQNLAGLQNRYPLNLWQEILGNCDAQLFLGCTDELTAEFISSRTGLASVSVSSKSKQLGTWRISNYTPEYRETSGVGKRPVLTPDEVLRLPIKQALVIIRGQKVLKVDKMDYSKHPEASKLRSCKASAHIPEWRRLEQEQPKPSAAQPKPQAPAPKKPVKKKPKAASTSTNTKQTAAVPTAEAPNGIITTDKDSILS